MLIAMTATPVLTHVAASLARILHEGGRVTHSFPAIAGANVVLFAICAQIQIVLFGFSARWALHLGRSSLNHSYGYASVDDRPTCFAHHALKSEPFMQHAG